MQNIGLSNDYKDKSSEVGKWLTHVYGLPFLPAADVEDAFVYVIMADVPDNPKCVQFADYLI